MLSLISKTLSLAITRHAIADEDVVVPPWSKWWPERTGTRSRSRTTSRTPGPSSGARMQSRSPSRSPAPPGYRGSSQQRRGTSPLRRSPSPERATSSAMSISDAHFATSFFSSPGALCSVISFSNNAKVHTLFLGHFDPVNMIFV